jgi:hypothetical protein
VEVMGKKFHVYVWISDAFTLKVDVESEAILETKRVQGKDPAPCNKLHINVLFAFWSLEPFQELSAGAQEDTSGRNNANAAYRCWLFCPHKTALTLALAEWTIPGIMPLLQGLS